ncbi:MAG: hypothetical protein O7C75_06320 [Verrucomicrobia bacterium]|nr:hypothetical protein [Verrucomicrobiota bacterium]
MQNLAEEFELQLRNLYVDFDQNLEAFANWNEKLWRGPRILLPIHVDALVVEKNETEKEWAKVKMEPTAIPGFPEGEGADASSEKAQPLPFETYEGREAGVHLLWSLPDSLTLGEQKQLGVDKTEQEVEFPLTPDRWVVIRSYPGETRTSKRHATAWVIESEDQKVTPLPLWTGDDSEEKSERWLTALGYGDPVFSAYYDNVKNIFAFHDQLDDVPQGPISYMVCGWYSNPEDDPLFQPASRGAWKDKLDVIGLSLGESSEDLELRLSQVANEAAANLEAISYQFRKDTKEQFAIGLYQSPKSSVSFQSEQVVTSRQLQEGRAGRPISFAPATAAIAADAGKSLYARDFVFTEYWPRQTLCHGMTYDVRWNGSGGSYDTSDAGIPQADAIKLALGNTGIQALAALIAKRRNNPNFEPLLSAFHYGILQSLQDQDGVSLLESLLHSEGFNSKPGGEVEDTIMEGDFFPKNSNSETAIKDSDREKKKQADKNNASSPINALKTYYRQNITYEELSKGKGDPLVKDVAKHRDFKPRKSVRVKRALPRYWDPKDPVILFSEVKRALQHGEDTRLSKDSKLLCRLTGETVKGMMPAIASDPSLTSAPVGALASAADLSTADFTSGQIPFEVGQLFHEALLMDETVAPIIAKQIIDKDLNGAFDNLIPADYTRFDMNQAAVETRIRVEQTVIWQANKSETVDTQALAATSALDGKTPTFFCINAWQRPWIPLQLDWEVELFISKNISEDWLLSEHDFEPAEDTESAIAERTSRIINGRSLLTPGVTKVLSEQLARFLADELEGVTDDANSLQETRLDQIGEALNNLDVLAASFSGFHDDLLNKVAEHQFFQEGDEIPDVEQLSDKITDDLVQSVRAGHFRINRLRIIDAFGQFYDVSKAAILQAARADEFEVPNEDAFLRLAPRIVQPSRLMFRMLSAESDANEATKLASPVSGWLIPDHLDQALEFFDATGGNLGQIRLRPSAVVGEPGKAIEWQGVPGKPESFGANPQIANRHVQGLVNGMLAVGEIDDLEGVETDARTESALSAMLRMIDATQWTVDPLGRNGDRHLSVIIGRPLAIVRAILRIELDGDAAEPELLRHAFPVRLGQMTRLNDGLMGYFLNDDYHQFYPIHESIASNTRPHAPHQGFLGPIASVNNYYRNFESNTQPVVHPYINTDPHVLVRPGQPVMLTMLVDPRGAIHATSGIVPRKRIELMTEHISNALSAISLTFQIGPVLTDPESIRMPLSSEIKGNWSWVRKTDVTVWQEDPIVQATEEGQLTTKPAYITEGWLKLSEALGREDESEAS